MDELEYVLGQLFSAYANTRVDEGTVAIYTRLLADIPPADLQTVVDQCIASSKFLPTVAEIREQWYLLTSRLGQPSATEGWADVLRQIRAVGYIGKPTFGNPITEAVVKAIGWRELCASENIVADRAHFMRMYDQLVARGEQVQGLLPQSLEMAEQRIGTGLQPIAKLLPITQLAEEN